MSLNQFQASTHTSDRSSAFNQPQRKPDHSTRSCVSCHGKKIRCDKSMPCSNCKKSGRECIFPPPGRKPRILKRPRKADLVARLRYLEDKVNRSGSSPQYTTAAAGDLSHDVEITTSQQEGNCKYADQLLDPTGLTNLDTQSGGLGMSKGSTRYVDEIQAFRDILEYPRPGDDEETNFSMQLHSVNSSSYGSFLFGFYSSASNLLPFRPTPDKAHLLWNIYEGNVAPLVTVFHQPTLKQMILQATTDPDCLDRKREAIVFSVYFGAVASMTQAQCMLLLGEGQTSCLQRYRFAAEQAIARAGFPQVRDLMVLQAMVLFLICVRRHDNNFFVSAMTALVLRLGRELSLHRDGTHFGLSPFITEMRRRLWWHIYLLEIHSCAEQGTKSQIDQGSYDTQLPLNIHDEDISSNSETFPTERQTFTAITFCLVRVETAISLHQLKLQNWQNKSTLQQLSLTAKEQGRMLDELRRRLEGKYFAFCDLNDPIQWVSVTICHLAIFRAWLTISLSTRDEKELSLSGEERDRLFLTSCEIVEFAHLLEVNEKTAHWGWFFNTYIQWLAFSFLLSELAKRPSDPVTDRAWIIAEHVYNKWNRDVLQRKKMAWRPLSQLMTRVSELRNQPLD